MSAPGSIATSTSEHRIFDRLDYMAAGAIALLSFVVYLRTMAPGLLYGDSGEFQTIVGSGGLAHGPGYPIYLILCKIINLLPFATPAYKTNLASGIFGSCGAAIMYFLGRTFGTRRIYSFAGAFALAFHWIYWWHSTVAEVYTISIAWLIAVILMAVIWKRTRSSRSLLQGGLLGGLSLGLHPTIFICAPFVFLYMAFNKAKKAEWKSLFAGIVAGLAITFAGYFYFASNTNPTSDINSVSYSAGAFGMKKSDFDSPVVRVMYTLTLKQFRGGLEKSSENLVETNTRLWGTWLADSIGFVFAAAGALGMIWLFLKKPSRGYIGWREGFLIISCFTLQLFFALRYSAHDIEVFFLPSQALLIGTVACGLQMIESGFLRIAGARVGVAKPLPKWPMYATAAVVLIGALPPIREIYLCSVSGKTDYLTGIPRVWPYPIDKPDLPHQQAQGFADAIEDNSLVLNDWLMVYPILYVTTVEQNRPKVEVIELTPEGSIGHVHPSLEEQLRLAYPIRPIYAPGISRSLMGEYDFYLVPATVPVYRLAKKGEKPPMFFQDGRPIPR